MPDYTIERLLPDGATHLIIELDQQPKYIFDNATLEPKQRCVHAWVSGMHTRFLSISALPCSCMLIVRFRPGGSYPFLQLPVHELNELVVDAEQVLGPTILELRERLLEAPTPAGRIALVESWLCRRARYQAVPEAVIAFAVDQINAGPRAASLEHIARQTGYSQKQFIHLFKKHVGLTPKTFQRIQRFNRVLQEIEQGRLLSWTQISHDCGYYDQAHFIREFREFAGFSPEVFLQQERSFVNYVAIE